MFQITRPSLSYVNTFRWKDDKNHMASTATRNSVAGNEHHTPKISHALDRRKAMGIITKNPRSNEIMWAGSG